MLTRGRRRQPRGRSCLIRGLAQSSPWRLSLHSGNTGTAPARWSLVTEQGAYALIGRQTGIGGDQFDTAIRLEDRLHYRFAEFDGADLAATPRTLEMGLCSEGTTGATAPTRTVHISMHHELMDAGGIDRFDGCLETEHG